MNKTLIGVVLVVAVLLSIMPMAHAQSTFAWTLGCQRTGGLVGNIYAYWNWTSNGVTVQHTLIFCSSPSGQGTVPSNANGIVAVLKTGFRNCSDPVSVTKSFAPGTVPSITLKSFCSTFAYGQRDTVSATLTLGPIATK